VLQFS